MFLKIAGFEFRYQIKNPVFWVASGFFFLLCFGALASSNVQIGSGGNVHKNAPFAIVQATLIFVTMYMFITTAFVANVVIRDDETGFGPILRTTRVSKFDYLYGRFTGAFAAAALSFLAVPAGLAFGALMPWIDKETLGPFIGAHYLDAYLFWGLPGIFISSALFFTLATITRSMMWTYVGVIAFFILRTVMGIVLRKPGLETVAALWEPFGIGTFGYASQYWTSVESNTLMPPLAGLYALNRAIWMGVSLAVLGLAYALFRFETPGLSGKAKKAARRAERAAKVEAKPARPITQSHAVPTFGASTALQQFIVRTRLDMGQVFGSPAYLVLLALGCLLSIANVWFATQLSAYGGDVYPVTRVMIEALNGGFTIIALIVAIYYAGELVWREQEKQDARDNRRHPDTRLGLRRTQGHRHRAGPDFHPAGLGGWSGFA